MGFGCFQNTLRSGFICQICKFNFHYSVRPIVRSRELVLFGFHCAFPSADISLIAFREVHHERRAARDTTFCWLWPCTQSKAKTKQKIKCNYQYTR